MNEKIRWMARIAITAAMYVVLTIVCYPFSFGQIQIRLAEILMLLVCYNKKYTYGVVIGCLIVNFLSPMGLIDVLFGTIATLLSCILMIIIKRKFISFLIPVIINALIIGLELYLVLDLPLIISMIYVGIGELIAMIIGLIISFIDKNEKVRNALQSVKK